MLKPPSKWNKNVAQDQQPQLLHFWDDLSWSKILFDELWIMRIKTRVDLFVDYQRLVLSSLCAFSMSSRSGLWLWLLISRSFKTRLIERYFYVRKASKSIKTESAHEREERWRSQTNLQISKSLPLLSIHVDVWLLLAPFCIRHRLWEQILAVKYEELLITECIAATTEKRLKHFFLLDQSGSA